MDNEERTKQVWQINDDISNKPYKRKISLRTRQQSRQGKFDDLIFEESPLKEQTKGTPTFKFSTQQKLFKRNQLVQEQQIEREDDLRGTYIHYGDRQKHRNNQSNNQEINYDNQLLEGRTFIEELQRQGEEVDQYYLKEDDRDRQVPHYGRHFGKTEEWMLNVGREQLLNITEDELLNMTEESDFLKITKTLHQRVGLANKTEKNLYDYGNVPQRLRRQLEIKYYPQQTMLIEESKYEQNSYYKQENLGQQYLKQDTQQQSMVEKVELNDNDENFQFGQKIGIDCQTEGKEQEGSIIEKIISEDEPVQHTVQHRCSDLVHGDCPYVNRKTFSMTKGNLTIRQNETDPIKQDGKNSKNMQESYNQQQSSSSLVKIMISSSQNEASSPSLTQQVMNNSVDHHKLAQLPQELQSLLKNQPNKILEDEQDQEQGRLGISEKADKKYEFIKILQDEEEIFIKENEEISSKLQEKLKQIQSMMSNQQKDYNVQAKYEARNNQQQQQLQQQANQANFRHQPQAIHLQHSINTSQSLPAIIPLTDDEYLHQDQNIEFPQSNIMIVMTSDEEECQKVKLTLQKEDLSNIYQFIPQSDFAIMMTNNSEDIVERVSKEIRMIQNSRGQQHTQSAERKQQFLSGKQKEEFAQENRPAQQKYSIKEDELRNMQQSKQSEYIINIPSSFGIPKKIWLGGSLQNNSQQPKITQDNNDLRLSTPNQAHLLRTTQLLSQNEIPSLLESSLGNQVPVIDQVKLQKQIKDNPLSRKIHDDVRYLEPLNYQDIYSTIHIDPDLELLEEVEPFTGTITQAMIQDIITDVSPLKQVNPIDHTQELREKMQEIRPRVTFNDQKTQYFIWSSSKQVISDQAPQVMSSPKRIASNKSIIDSLNLISSPNIPQLSSLSQSNIPPSSQPSIPSNQLIIGSNKMIGSQADMGQPSPIKQSITQNHETCNNHEETIFQSFDEGSISTTQYFDCNLLLNNSLSFSSNMVNKSLLQGNRGNTSLESGSTANVSIQQNNVGKNQEKQDYNTILQDLGEQDEQLNTHTKINERNNIDQSCNGHSKIDTDRKQKPSEQALENSFLNTSRSSPDKHRYHPQSSQRLSLRELQALQSKRTQKMQLISQMSCIFIQLIKQHKSYYLQFLSQIQEQLFIYKQSFQHLKEEFLQLLNVKLAGVKEQVREEEAKRLREELEVEYANRLEERLREELAAMEEDFLEREDNWRQDMILRLQQQHTNRYRQAARDGYRGGEQQNYSWQEQDYQYDQQQYSNNHNNNRHSSTILPTQISVFRTTNSKISPNPTSHSRPLPFLQHQHHLQSILNQLQNQNQSLCQQLMLQQEHTQLMNEEQEKIRKKLRRMNDLEDELEELKRENIQVKKMLFEVEEEKESIKELLQNELRRITADRDHQIKELQEQLRRKYEQQLLTMQQQFKSTILQLTNNASMQQSHQQVSQYRAQLERVQKQLQGSVKEKQQSKQTISDLTASNQQLKEQIESLQQTLLDLQSQLHKKTLKLQTQSSSSQKNIQSLEQKIEQLSKKNLQLISQLQQSIVQNAKVKEDVNRLKKEVEMGSREVGRLRESQIQLYQQITELKKQGNSKDMEIKRLEKKVQQLNREIVTTSNRESIINASSKISQLNTNRFRPNKELVRNITSQNNINANNNTSSILSSNLPQQPSLIHDPYTQHRHITRQLPILSNKPSLNEHCYTASNNAAVNKILENIRLKKSTVSIGNVSIGNGQNNSIRQDISCNEPDQNSSYFRQLNQSGARPIVNNKLQSIESYQFNPSLYQSSLKNIKGPTVSFPSKIPAQEQFKASHILESNNTNQELYHQFSPNDPNNRSNISNLSQLSQHQAYPSRQITAMISPKSPSSSSVLSKKVSSSQKDKKMSIISLKLQKLRSDIREEIKEISHIK